MDPPRVVRHEKLGDDAAEVLEETVGRRRALHGDSRKHRQPVPDGVAGARRERPVEPVRPVLPKHLIAVEQDAFQRTVRAEPPQHATDIGVKMDVGGLRRQLVALKPHPLRRRRLVARPVGDKPHPQHRPFPIPLRRGPGEAAGSVHLRREIDDLPPDDAGGRRKDAVVERFREGRSALHLPADVPRATPPKHLHVEILPRGASVRRRKRQHRDVAVEPIRTLRQRQPALEPLAALHPHRRVRDELHGKLGRDPRSAGTRPAAAVRETELKPEPARLTVGMLKAAEPFFGAEPHRPRRKRQSRIEDLRPADSRRRHRLEIRSDAGLRDVAVHPMPPRVRLRLRRRRPEPLLYRKAECRKARTERQREKKNGFHIQPFCQFLSCPLKAAQPPLTTYYTTKR